MVAEPSARTPPGHAAGVGPLPASNVSGRSQVPSSPAVDRRREVWLTAQLLGSLFAHAGELGDVDEAHEPPTAHGRFPSEEISLRRSSRVRLTQPLSLHRRSTQLGCASVRFLQMVRMCLVSKLAWASTLKDFFA